ncbi:hypothetical protein GYMLUDRAFT_245419 [Collybiopsis luxurians FD-317 M1]|uniref:Uncharacterized protein n=1 Tax=Collybiopsis luxurians FD-317 M1 TaxID=944289 RepID=A0A0D0BV06_9AGAR|nr:hypothetical protein GYMLUDRAFT_245419 [Collybiopsis luxurians FD-317 M1]
MSGHKQSKRGKNDRSDALAGLQLQKRSTSKTHYLKVAGISAASGKLGAIISECGFAQIKAQHGEPEAFLGHIPEMCVGFMFTGIFSILLVPETKGRSLDEEELSKAKAKCGRTNENTVISTPPPLFLRLVQWAAAYTL